MSKEEAEKLVGTHWTMKVWQDGDAWGGHVFCHEDPKFNCVEVFTDGVEKSVDHPMFGGKAQVLLCKRPREHAKAVGFFKCCPRPGSFGFNLFSHRSIAVPQRFPNNGAVIE
jgi:hypothetical protein